MVHMFRMMDHMTGHMGYMVGVGSFEGKSRYMLHLHTDRKMDQLPDRIVLTQFGSC